MKDLVNNNLTSAEILRESEERFRAIVNQATAGIAETDLTGRFLLVNDRYCEIAGYPREELLEMRMQDITHAADLPRNLELFEQMIERGNAFVIEKRYVRKDGTEVWVSNSVSVVRSAAGEPQNVLAVTVDISERRAAEENQKLLLEISEKIRLAENTDDLLFDISKAVGEHLKVRRCLFNEIDLEGDRETIHRDYCREAPSVAGVHPVSDYSPVTTAEMQAGRTVVNRDSQSDPRTAQFYEQIYEPNGERAYIAVPLMRDASWVASLWVSDDRPRDWSEQEIGLLESVAERVWLTVEKLRSEAALRESEERFAKAFNSSPLVVTITSLKTGKLLEVNETFVNITGYSREEAIGRTTAELGLWKKGDDREAELELVRNRGQIRSREYCFRMRNGREIVGLLAAELLEIGGEPCALTVIQDITERKLAEELIRESEEKFRNLANSISQFAWMTDASGYIFWYNERWFEYTGTTLEEMQGWGWQKVHHPDEIERVTEKFKQHLASGEIWEDTFPLRSRAGEYRWFLSRAVPIRDENGQIVRWIGTNTDIEEVRRARLQAEQANRLKDEFLATVSHELRTPLNAILGWSNMLQSGTATDEMKNRAIEVIYRNAKSQAQLIEDLLDTSRIITGKMRIEPRPIGFAPVIKAAVDTIRPAAEAKSIELETDVDCEPCMIGGDAQRLQQIAWNLLSNAVKFTPEGGKVKVLLENTGSHARLTVSDTGKGIEAEFLPFMFERFRQEDASSTRRHGGLGLGLAIVRHLVELHGGKIFADSAGENLGSTFTLELPLAFSGGKQTGREQKNQRETLSDGFGKYQILNKLKGVRVVLVDDELDTLEMLDTALTDSGAEVQVASSAQDAFEILRDWLPDVLVSDIAMPGEDGYSLIKKVRELADDKGGLIPAIAMTAYVRAEDKMRVLASGFQSYIPKPAEPAELITAILDLTSQNRPSRKAEG